jgi:hypothetical protein
MVNTAKGITPEHHHHHNLQLKMPIEIYITIATTLRAAISKYWVNRNLGTPHHKAWMRHETKRKIAALRFVRASKLTK